MREHSTASTTTPATTLIGVDLALPGSERNAWTFAMPSGVATIVYPAGLTDPDRRGLAEALRQLAEAIDEVTA